MRLVQELDKVAKFKRSKKKDAALAKYLAVEIEDAMSAKNELDQAIREALRQYNGIPRNPTRNIPIENAPNIEVTLGAIAVDALYAQALGNVFSVSPLTTCRETIASFTEAAKPLQRLVDHCAITQWGARKAAEHGFLDCIQLGTSAFYVPYLKGVKKTLARKVIERGPRILPIPVEDIVVPGGATQDPEQMPFCGFRFWASERELQDHANVLDDDLKWSIDELKATGTQGFVRSQRELMGKTQSNRKLNLMYEMYHLYVSFDYDNDGEDEELHVVWDRTSKKVAWVGYSSHDYRAMEIFVYQVRAHLAFGIGVMEMMRPYQEEVTEAHNDRSVNVKLANTKMYATRIGQVDEGTINAYPGRNIPLQDPEKDIREITMSEVYPSAVSNQMVTMSLAERRVGVNELSGQKPSSVLGNRTPAFTAASVLQQQNTRFGPAFDNMRGALSKAIVQCLWRLHEKLLSQGTNGEAARDIIAILGEDDGMLVINLLRLDNFTQGVAVELTASSASVNRDSDKQNALLLVNLLLQYYEKCINLATLAATPGVPPLVAETAKKVSEAAGEIIERTVRTFDQIRDPKRFILDLSHMIDEASAQAGVTQQGLGGLVQQLQQQFGGQQTAQQSDQGASQTTQQSAT